MFDEDQILLVSFVYRLSDVSLHIIIVYAILNCIYYY